MLILLTKSRLSILTLLLFLIYVFLPPFYRQRINNPQTVNAASGDVILLWDTANGSVPSGWTCISCNPGEAYYGVFPRGASSYGSSTYGGTTHAHTYTYSSATAGNSDDSARGNSAGSAVAVDFHTHTWESPSSGNGDVTPEYKDLNFIKASNPTVIPANVIAIFDTTSLPTGWTRYSALDSKYLRGYSSNATGGSATHNHSTGAITSGSSGAILTDTGNGNSAAVSHTHALSISTSPNNNNDPSYVQTVFAYNSSTADIAIPSGLIAFFDATPSSGWTSISGGSPWNNNLIKGASSYGTTGGNTTHNHTGSLSLTSGTPSNTASNRGSTGDLYGAHNTHTHQITYTIDSQSSMPVYRDTIIAKRDIITTVSTSGNQTSEITIGTANSYVGGAFAVISNSTVDITQILIKENGTVDANSNLSNAKIFYETTGTCSYDTGESQFGSAVSFNSSEIATFSGTMPVGTSQICLYVVVDVGSGASNNQTLEIEVSNPSTDMTVSSGSVSPATAVAINGTTTLKANVSISISTNGSVSFGTIALNTTRNTTSGDLNDIETISVDAGPADLDIKTTVFSQAGNTWTLGTSNGPAQIKWEFSKDGSSWTTFEAADPTTYVFDTNVSQSLTRNLYFRLTTPTSTNSYLQYSSTVTIIASAP